MRHWLSRLSAILALLVTFAATPREASAQALPYLAAGSAQFQNDNDFLGTGVATYLGHYTEEGSVTFTPFGTIVLLGGWAVYTAANGDKLKAFFSGVLDPATGAITAKVKYAGGSGRFADATGFAALTGQLLGRGAVVVEVEGSIQL